ncbi:hypothetical protein BH10CYA1_BH10CYA1_50990 [soil metagenome]
MEEIHLEAAEFTRLSLENFFKQFANEKECLRAIPSLCRACKLLVETDERCFVCPKCKTKTWRTAATYFHGLQKLMPTFAWIWLHEDRATISINKFAELFEIPYSSAWDANAKMKAVLEQEMNKHDVFEVVSNIFDKVICKRTVQSSAGKHPNYEEDELEETDLEELEGMDSDQKAVYAELKSQPIEFDVLYHRSGLSIAKFGAALTMLDINGVAKRHLGDQFSLKKTTPTTIVSGNELETIHQFLAYAKNFHGVSRKYLQRHLAAFWTLWGVNRWSTQTLLQTIMKYGRLSRADILAYHSPKKVRIHCSP